MKIIEGKQAVLHPYRTEKECVQPVRGQNVQAAAPVVCPVTELPTVDCIPLEMRRPVEAITSRVTDADMQKPVYGSPRKAPESVGRVFPVETHAPVDCTLQTASERTLQPVRAQVNPVSPEWGQMWNEKTNGMSGRKKRKWLADNIMHMADMK